MIRALYVAGSGMQAQQAQMDVVANNLANANTVGYKRVTAEFQDLLYEQLARPAAGTGPDAVQVGHGVRLAATRREMAAGALNPGGPLDLAIQGSGFFHVRRGETDAYTRAGAFHLDSRKRIVTARGDLLLGADGQPVALPPGVDQVDVAADGTIRYTDPATREARVLGRLALVRFANPAGLLALGENLLVPTAASGPAEAGNPGEGGLGQIRQGFLEASNVEVVNEMVNLIMAQRAYEINARAVQSADEMLQQANNLRR